MSDADTSADDGDDLETTTINLRVTERFLEEIDAAWKEEGYTSRSEFLRHAVRDAVELPGMSRQMLASIAAEEHAMRKGEGKSIPREDIVTRVDADE